MPNVAWACLSSSSSSDNILLDLFTDLGLHQIINEFTHIRENCLDPIFTSLGSVPFHVPRELSQITFPFSKFHSSIITEVYEVLVTRNHFSEFKHLIKNFFSLYELQTFQIKASDFLLWYNELKNKLSVLIAKKRRKRVSAPFF